MVKLGYAAEMNEIFEAYYRYWDEKNHIIRAELIKMCIRDRVNSDIKKIDCDVSSIPELCRIEGVEDSKTESDTGVVDQTPATYVQDADVYKRQEIYSESLFAKYSESLSLYRRDWRLVLHHMPSEQRRQSRWAR